MKQDERMQQEFADLEWAQENTEFQEKYDGQVIALHQRNVVAHGWDESTVFRQVKELGLSRDDVVIVNMLSDDLEAPPDMDP